MINLLTRASWEARAADPALHPGALAAPGQMQLVEALMSGVAEEVVDYMLFVDEAPLPNPVAGRSGFAERMSARGPRDRQGRSLYELDLTRRLMKYPCSYLIYSPAFDALPPLAKAPIYRRMWQVLAGEAREPRYRSLSLRGSAGGRRDPEGHQARPAGLLHGGDEVADRREAPTEARGSWTDRRARGIPRREECDGIDRRQPRHYLGASRLRQLRRP